MRRFAVCLVVSAGLAACRAPADTTPAAAVAAAPRDMPAMLLGYRLDTSWVIRGYPTDTSWRYTGRPARITVIRYPVRGGRFDADSGAMVTNEGRNFRQLQPLLVQRGTIDAFQPLWDTTEVLDLGGWRTTEHTSAVVVRARGRTNVEMQHLYIVGGRFLKVRASLPTSLVDSTSIHFARALAAYLGGAAAARP